MKYDVFISYSRKDCAIVENFADELIKAGYSIWMDVDGIESGDEFKRKIASAIRKSNVFLFFSSAASNKSEWTVKEVNYAIKKNIHIIPIKLDDTEYNESVDFDLCAVDFIQCNGTENIQYAFDKLLRSLQNRIGAGSSNVLDKNEENVVEEEKNDNISIDGSAKFFYAANVPPSDEETTPMQVKKPESEKAVGLDIEKLALPDRNPVKWMDFAQFCDYNGYSLKKIRFFSYIKVIASFSWLLMFSGIGLHCIDSEEYDLFIAILFFYIAVIFSILSIFGSHYLYARELCDIQDTSSQLKFIRNKRGLIGISISRNRRSKQLLRMEYNNIFCINDDTFICTCNGSYGIYNATKKKMVVPVEYDSIEYKNGKIYASSRDGVVSVFTDRGYRVVE